MMLAYEEKGFEVVMRIRISVISVAVSMLLIFVWTKDIRELLFRSKVVAYFLLLCAFSIIILQFMYRYVKYSKVNTGTFLWLIALVIILLRNADIVNRVFNNPIQTCIIILCIPMLACTDIWYAGFIKCITFLGCIYAGVTIVSLIFPEAYLNGIIPMMPQESQRELYYQFISGRIPGLTAHYSTNGIYLGIASGIVAICTYTSYTNKRRMNIAITLLLFAALLITGKRAQSLFCVTSLVFTYYIYASNHKKGRLSKLIIGAVVIVGCIFIGGSIFPPIMNVIVRIEQQMLSGDVFNGRLSFYSSAIAEFWKNPIWGSGWGSMWYIIGIDVHNVYIQLLAETGIVGFLLFLGIFLYTLLHTIRLLKRSRVAQPLSDTTCRINQKDNERILAIALFVQCFFLQYCLTGNPLYDEQTLYVYVMSCCMVYRVLEDETKYKERNECKHEKNNCHFNIS